MKFTEDQLLHYSLPLSKTEDDACKNVIRMVIRALQKNGYVQLGDMTVIQNGTYAYTANMKTLRGEKHIKIFLQGSYANDTNVRKESDVDIAIVEEDVFYPEYRAGITRNAYGFEPASSADTPKKFKDNVENALKSIFGPDVKRGDKSIKLVGNTYRKDADTVPCRRLRDYRDDWLYDVNNYVQGIIIYPDSGGKIVNYPEQHIINARVKDNATNGYYKKYVRILKKMRYLMLDSTHSIYVNAAKNINSFILESLLWNVENSWYALNCPKYRMVFVFSMMIQELKRSIGEFDSFKEANGIKPLCENESVKTNLVAFINSLSSFYEYD